MAQAEPKSLAEKLQSVPKSVLFLILILCTSLPLFLPEIKVPNKPDEATMDFYHKLMTIPEGSTVLISSDWTNSTRGESVGQFDALMKILMRRNIKFAIFTAADAQAPQVARDEIGVLNTERTTASPPQRAYEQWNDYVILGYFPNAEGTLNAIRTNPRKAFAGKKVVPPGQQTAIDAINSPVLKNINKVEDFAMVIVVTASNTSNVTIERLSDKLKGDGKLAMQVTGVMGPETRVYYDSGQLGGLSIGLKGVYDLETMMENGLNTPGPNAVTYDKFKDSPVPGFPGMPNKGKGTTYYPTLHFAALLLIIAVLVGNVGMILTKRKGN